MPSLGEKMPPHHRIRPRDPPPVAATAAPYLGGSARAQLPVRQAVSGVSVGGRRLSCRCRCRAVTVRSRVVVWRCLRQRRPWIHHRASAGGGREGAGELGQWRRRRAGGWRHQHTSFRLHACGRSVDQQGSAGEPPLFTSERGWERGTGRRRGGWPNSHCHPRPKPRQ